MTERESIYERIAKYLKDYTILPVEEADRIRADIYHRYVLPAPGQEPPGYHRLTLDEFIHFTANLDIAAYSHFNGDAWWLGYESSRFFYLLKHFFATHPGEVLLWYALRRERAMLRTADLNNVFNAIAKEDGRLLEFFITNPACDYLIYFGGHYETDGLVVMGTACTWLNELSDDLDQLLGIPHPDAANWQQEPEFELFATDLFVRNWGHAIGIDIEAESPEKRIRFRILFEKCQIEKWRWNRYDIARPRIWFSHLQRLDDKGWQLIPARIDTEAFELTFKYETVTVEKLGETDRSPDEPA
jgi:hypothetical protein